MIHVKHNYLFAYSFTVVDLVNETDMGFVFEGPVAVNLYASVY